MRRATFLVCTLLAYSTYVAPEQDGVLFYEAFDDQAWYTRWRHSENNKYDGRFNLGRPQDWKNDGLRVSTCMICRTNHHVSKAGTMQP